MNEPEKYRYDKEIIRLTVGQIEKDFGSYLSALKLSGNELLAWEELVNQVKPVVEKLFKNDRSAFQALIYRIDIPDKELRNFLALPAGERMDRLSEGIIRREFKKVLIRKYFSKGA